MTKLEKEGKKTARIQKLPWGRPALTPVEDRHWPGRSLAIIFLVLAALIVFHETRSQGIWNALSTAWQATPALPSAPAPGPGTVATPDEIANISQEVRDLTGILQERRWTTADTSLDIIETNWDSLVGKLARQGVGTTELNRFTENLGQLASSISARNIADSLMALNRLSQDLNHFGKSPVSGGAPTLQQLESLTRSIQADLHRGDKTAMRQHVKLLSQLVNRFEQGF